MNPNQCIGRVGRTSRRLRRKPDGPTIDHSGLQPGTGDFGRQDDGSALETVLELRAARFDSAGTDREPFGGVVLIVDMIAVGLKVFDLSLNQVAEHAAQGASFFGQSFQGAENFRLLSVAQSTRATTVVGARSDAIPDREHRLAQLPCPVHRGNGIRSPVPNRKIFWGLP